MESEGTLLLSPHSDDMVMAAYGIVTRKLLPGPLSLLTVFSWTNYIILNPRTFADIRFLLNVAPRPQELAHSMMRNMHRFGTHPRRILPELLDLRQPYKVSRIRVFEDLRFSKMAGVKFCYLNLPDSKCRRGRPIKDPEWPISREENILGVLCSAIKGVISRMRAGTVVAPWPYGVRQHIDHRLVSETATRVAEETGVRLLYVDDQPYSRRPPGTMTDRRGRSYASAVVKLDPSEMTMKYKAMNIYRSQMVPGYLKAVRGPPPGHPELGNSETLWQPSQPARLSPPI
jgi:LmbE family N-acetylglucosaminyl deacetylase